MAANNGQNNSPISGVWKVILIIVLAILAISPLDIIPDAVPVAGIADDLAYILGIVGTITSMVKGKGGSSGTTANGQPTYTPPMYNDVDSNVKKPD